MPVSVESAISGPFTPNGVTTAFPFLFKAASASEIMVIDQAGNTLSDALYSVTLGEGEGGTVTFTVAPALASYTEIYIVSDPLMTQPADFGNTGPSFNPASVTAAFDRAGVRDLRLRYDITNALALAATASDDAAAAVAAVAGLEVSAGVGVAVASRGLLAALATSGAAYLTETGREGDFVWSSANLSAQVTADPLQGLYVAPTAAPTGASGAWVRRYSGTAYVSWWGITLNSQAAAAANLAAWNACRALVKHRTMPALGTFWVSGPFRIDDAYSTTIFPQRSDGYGDTTGCRVLSTDTTLDAMVIGPETQPAAGGTVVENFPRNVTVTNPCAGWGVAHAALSGADSALRKAIRINYLIDALIEYPWAHEAPIGIYYYGLVGTRVVRPKAFRSAALGGNPATDKFFGQWAKGDPAVLAGGNASLTIENAIVEMASGMSLADQCGFICDGAFVDVWIDKLETSACKNGIRITGTTASGQANSNIDFRVDKLIVDAFTGIALEVTQVAPNGSVQIKDIECMSGVGATYGIKVDDCLGLVNIEGTIHGIGASNGGAGTMRGFRCDDSQGVSCNLRLIDCPRPVELAVLTDFDFTFAINNPTVTANAYQGAVFFNGLQRGIVKVRIKGKANAFPQGVYTAASDSNHVTFLGMESIESAAISGAVNKLVLNGVTLTAPGAYTPAGVSNAAGTMTVVGSMT